MGKIKDFDNIPEPLFSFIKYIETIQGKSKNTAREYFYDIRTFYRFLKINYGCVLKNTEFENIDISDIDIDFIKKVNINDIYSYIYFLSKDRNNSAASVARKTASIRSYFKYLCRSKILQDNPIADLESIKLKKQIPRYFSVEDSINLLETIDGKNAERDYCIITLFLNCGMRLFELVNIDITDLRKDTIVITGKGNKERTVYLNEACIDAINGYMKIRVNIEATASDKNALFISERKKRISRRTVQYIVEKYVKKIGLDPHKYTTHKLRHTAATLMYRSGVDIRVLQEILGHEQLSTTEIYTHVDNEQIRSAVSKNPLSSIKKE